MSLFSFFKKNKESYSLVFNIGSGSVSGGIVKFTEKAGEDVIQYSKEIIPFQQEISIAKHIELMKSTLSTLANKLHQEGIRLINKEKGQDIIIDRVFYLFSSPWCVSQTKTIRVNESKGFKVTESYLNRIIDEQERQFQSDITVYGKIIERKIIQVKINGYAVSDYNNKVTKDLEVSVFFSVVPERLLQIVEEAISKTFIVKNVWCHSTSLSIFSVIRNLFPQNEDFIHIDISEEITDISIVRNNVISSNASIPFGRNNFIRQLSTILGVSEEIADSMINMHSKKQNDELAGMKLAVAMDAAAKNWLTEIFKILDLLKEKIYVPEQIFLVTNSEISLFLKGKLEKHDFTVSLVDNRKIRSNKPFDDIIFKLELMFLDNIYKI